jgi:hypothetical protein
MKPNDSYKSVKTAPGRNTGRLNRNNLKVFKNIANDTNTCFYPADLGG